MNWAWDRVRRSLVEAKNGREDEPQRYVCPTKTCGGKVFLRPGRLRRPHFAHYANEGSDSCEDYHPGVYESLSILKSTDIDERSSSKQVGVEFSVRNASPTWRLRVRIPVTLNAAGDAEVCYGPDSYRVIDLAGLRYKALFVDAIPASEPLGIVRFHANVPSQVRGALAPSAILLNTDKITLFHAGRLSASGIAGPRYYWGASYYALTSSSAAIAFPDSILVKILSERHGWNCKLIRLPQNPDETIANWFDANSSLRAGIRSAKIMLIEPSLYSEKPGPEIETTVRKTIKIGIHRLGRETLTDLLRVEEGSTVIPIPLKNIDHATVEVRLPDRSERCLYVRFGTEPGILIDLRKNVVGREQPQEITISAVDASTGTQPSARLGSLKSHRILRGIRASQLSALKVDANAETFANLTTINSNGTIARTERLSMGDRGFASMLSGRLSLKTTGLLLTVPGYGSLFFSCMRSSKVVTAQFVQAALLDHRHAALIVAMRYNDTGPSDASIRHVRQSAAQAISNRYFAAAAEDW